MAKKIKQSTIKEGKILVFTAPSGAGKTTLVRHLLATYPEELAFSVSTTTRTARGMERDGIDYYFLSQKAFESKIKAGEFLEYEEVYSSQYYGTLKSEIKRIWDEDKVVLFDVEVHGAQAIKKAYPDQALVVFVCPPSEETLFKRLRLRGTEDEASLAKRIARASEELKYKDTFDKVLVNDNLTLAKQEAEDIVKAWLS